jgi:hypothetical protein
MNVQIKLTHRQWIALVSLLILGTVVWGGNSSKRPEEERRTLLVPKAKKVEVVEKIEEVYLGQDKQEDLMIRIQAIALEVKNTALYDSPLDRWNPDTGAISADTLLKNLNRHKQGEMIGGVVLVVTNDQEGQAGCGDENKEQTKKGDKEERHTCTSQQKIEFLANARIHGGDTIAIGFHYIHEVIHVENGAEAEMEREAEGIRQWEWQSQVSLTSGEPMIVGETINSDKTTFLILSAQIL